MSFAIAMGFISWSIAVWMLLGFTFVKSCEMTLKFENENTDEMVRLGAMQTIDDYNSRNWSGRVALVLWLGVFMIAIMFNKDTWKKKGS